MRKAVWSSREMAGEWFELDESGTLWVMKHLPPADAPGKRMTREEGWAIRLTEQEIEQLASAASSLLPKKHWAVRAQQRKQEATKLAQRKAWLLKRARSLEPSE